jgi:hypothetical protein
MSKGKKGSVVVSSNMKNDMLQLNYSIIKKFKKEVERIDRDDFIWINELTHKGYITPYKKF